MDDPNQNNKYYHHPQSFLSHLCDSLPHLSLLSFLIPRQSLICCHCTLVWFSRILWCTYIHIYCILHIFLFYEWNYSLFVSEFFQRIEFDIHACCCMRQQLMTVFNEWCSIVWKHHSLSFVCHCTLNIVLSAFGYSRHCCEYLYKRLGKGICFYFS